MSQRANVIETDIKDNTVCFVVMTSVWTEGREITSGNKQALRELLEIMLIIEVQSHTSVSLECMSRLDQGRDTGQSIHSLAQT